MHAERSIPSHPVHVASSTTVVSHAMSCMPCLANHPFSRCLALHCLALHCSASPYMPGLAGGWRPATRGRRLTARMDAFQRDETAEGAGRLMSRWSRGGQEEEEGKRAMGADDSSFITLGKGMERGRL